MAKPGLPTLDVTWQKRPGGVVCGFCASESKAVLFHDKMELFDDHIKLPLVQWLNDLDSVTTVRFCSSSGGGTWAELVKT
nr:hypothetical protein RP007_01167 [Rhizobium sp. P007]